jgi:hypothetical protein
LRAKARHTRWKEELKIVRKEMEWTCRSFQFLERKWTSRAHICRMDQNMKGHYSYAMKQAAIWSNWEEKAKQSFSEVLHIPVEKILNSDTSI